MFSSRIGLRYSASAQSVSRKVKRNNNKIANSLDGWFFLRTVIDNGYQVRGLALDVFSFRCFWLRGFESLSLALAVLGI
jgi:hypothetical protein